MINRFSASEALQHPWINVEGHQDVVHQKHLLTACNSFRLKKNEVITDKKETSFKREERKSLSDRKDVLYKRDSITKRETKLSPVRTSRRCLPGEHIHIPYTSLLSPLFSSLFFSSLLFYSTLSFPLYQPIPCMSFILFATFLLSSSPLHTLFHLVLQKSLWRQSERRQRVRTPLRVLSAVL